MSVKAKLKKSDIQTYIAIAEFEMDNTIQSALINDSSFGRTDRPL